MAVYRTSREAWKALDWFNMQKTRDGETSLLVVCTVIYMLIQG